MVFGAPEAIPTLLGRFHTRSDYFCAGDDPPGLPGAEKNRKTSSDLPSIFTEVGKLQIPFFRDPALREIQILEPWGFQKNILHHSEVEYDLIQ